MWDMLVTLGEYKVGYVVLGLMWFTGVFCIAYKSLKKDLQKSIDELTR